MDRSNRVDEFVVRSILGQKGLRTCHHGSPDILVTSECAQRNDAAGGNSARIAATASNPFITGIHISIRTISG